MFFFHSSTFTQYLWACTQHNFGWGKQYHYHFESVTHREKTVPLRSWTREILWPKRRLSITVKSIFIFVTCLICLSWTGKWVQMKKKARKTNWNQTQARYNYLIDSQYLSRASLASSVQRMVNVLKVIRGKLNKWWLTLFSWSALWWTCHPLSLQNRPSSCC